MRVSDLQVSEEEKLFRTIRSTSVVCMTAGTVGSAATFAAFSRIDAPGIGSAFAAITLIASGVLSYDLWRIGANMEQLYRNRIFENLSAGIRIPEIAQSLFRSTLLSRVYLAVISFFVWKAEVNIENNRAYLTVSIGLPKIALSS